MVLGVLFLLALVAFILWLLSRLVGGLFAAAEPPPEPLLPPAALAALTALRFQQIKPDLWSHSGREDFAYACPGALVKLHRLWSAPRHAAAIAVASGLDAEARLPEAPRDGLEPGRLLADGTVPGLTVQAQRVELEGETRRTAAASPADVALCQHLFTDKVAALLAAIPGASLQVETLSSEAYAIWVRWPEQGAPVGPSVEAAQKLVRAVDARLHHPLPAPVEA